MAPGWRAAGLLSGFLRGFGVCPTRAYPVLCSGALAAIPLPMWAEQKKARGYKHPYLHETEAFKWTPPLGDRVSLCRHRLRSCISFRVRRGPLVRLRRRHGNLNSGPNSNVSGPGSLAAKLTQALVTS